MSCRVQGHIGFAGLDNWFGAVTVVEQVLGDEGRLETFAQFREFRAQTEEQLELNGFLDRRHQGKLLQIHLQVARPLLGLRVRARCKLLIKLFGLILARICRLIVTEIVEDALGKLEGAVWEFDGGVLVQKTVVQAAERFVSLAYLPLLPIELDFYHVVSVGPMVSFILHHPSAGNRYLKRNFEE